MAGGSSPPPAPDPVRTAEAQTTSNRETAITNARLNRINQTSPFGTVNYNIEGYDPDGTPIYSQETRLSPELQGIYNNYTSMTRGMGDIGNQQISQLAGMYGTPFNLDDAIGQRQFAMQRQLLDPVMDRQRNAAENRLVQRGFNIGSEGYTRGMGDVADNENRAYLQAMLGSRQQGMQEAVANRSIPLNEFNAMRTGSQVGMPQQSNVPGVTQANTDVAGITNAAYNQQLQAWNMQNQNQNAMMGGMFGMGAAAMPFIFSDRRLKKDIERIGEGPHGLGVYEFSYLWDDARHVGYMADEVQAVAPWAVKEIGGFLAVNYSEV